MLVSTEDTRYRVETAINAIISTCAGRLCQVSSTSCNMYDHQAGARLAILCVCGLACRPHDFHCRPALLQAMLTRRPCTGANSRLTSQHAASGLIVFAGVGERPERVFKLPKSVRRRSCGLLQTGLPWDRMVRPGRASGLDCVPLRRARKEKLLRLLMRWALGSSRRQEGREAILQIKVAT